MVVADPSDSLAAQINKLLPDLRAVAGQDRQVTVCFDRGGWPPSLFADIIDARFGLLTWRKGPVPGVPAGQFTTVSCTDDLNASYLTNQMLNAINAPVEQAYAELAEAREEAARIPARVRLGDLSPQMKRLEEEVKQLTHAIRMPAFNTETMLAAALHGRYSRAGDEAYALVREALHDSGDIIPGHGELLIRLDPLTAPRRTAALGALCEQATRAAACYPGTDLVLRYDVKPHPALAGYRPAPARTTAGTNTSTDNNIT